MRGIGGPLLCIGDLLSDVGEVSGTATGNHESHPSLSSSSSSVSDSNFTPQSTDLAGLFQENYKTLNEALASSDQSWTALTLKLCTALETANKLVQSTNTNATLLSEKVGELEKIVKRGDAAVAAARTLHALQTQKGQPSSGS